MSTTTDARLKKLEETVENTVEILTRYIEEQRKALEMVTNILNNHQVALSDHQQMMKDYYDVLFVHKEAIDFITNELKITEMPETLQ